MTIPRDQWSTRLKKLSQSFEGWPVSLDVVVHSNGALREFRQMPLLGITAEPNGPIAIAVAGQNGDHVTHMIHSPTRVLLDTTDAGWNAALEIDAEDGTKSILHFRMTNDEETTDEATARS